MQKETNQTGDYGYDIAEIYSDLRNQVLRLNADEAGLTGTSESTVLAALMEIGYPEGIATVVAVADGSASLYLSSGGCTVGAGAYESVQNVAKSFIKQAQQYLPIAVATESSPLPQDGSVRFYFVSSGGLYAAEAIANELADGNHEYSPLFEE